MVLIFLNLIQAQPQPTSKVVWVVAILLFLAGVSMIVYFFTRLKRVEKEPEEDWSLSRNTLFVAPTPGAKEREGVPGGTPEPSAEPVESKVESSEVSALDSPDDLPPHVPYAETRELASEDFTGPTVTAPEEVTPWVPTEPRPAEVIEEPLPSAEATRALGSVQEEPPVEPPRGKEEGGAVFDEEVWAELGPSGSSHPADVEPAAFARVDESTSRAPFEAPSIEPVNVEPATQREPFEPPRIEPLAPRVGEAAPRLSKPVSEPVPASAHAPREVEPSIPSVGRERKMAGSVLGISPEAAKGPLILGTPSKAPDEFGIGSLTNYGKDLNEKAGHGGTIALAVAILLVAGAVLSYFYIPAVHARVDDLVMRMRGRNPAAEQAAVIANEPKARIFPARNPEVVKNMVKARGAVDNLSKQELANLYVEVSLERYDGGPADTRNIQVNPTNLAPAQRGVYEFPYDGKQYRGYGITRLTSNGEEVKFIAPKQQ
ncbi:MAG TPA: hypothetical protein VE262_17210 [Blastocatellia bacterium]|nr:hypothetical protein [Blastocatellia bacterium]